MCQSRGVHHYLNPHHVAQGTAWTCLISLRGVSMQHCSPEMSPVTCVLGVAGKTGFVGANIVTSSQLHSQNHSLKRFWGFVLTVKGQKNVTSSSVCLHPGASRNALHTRTSPQLPNSVPFTASWPGAASFFPISPSLHFFCSCSRSSSLERKFYFNSFPGCLWVLTTFCFTICLGRNYLYF